MVVQPGHLERLVEGFRAAGIDARILWRPEGDLRALKDRGIDGICVGQIDLDAAPIFRVELCQGGCVYDWQVREDRSRQVYYCYHYVFESPGWTEAIRLRRVKRRRFWVFGPVVGHRWKGRPSPEILNADHDLNGALDHARLDEIGIRSDRGGDCTRIVYGLMGQITNRNVSTGTVGAMFRGDFKPEINIPGETPTIERIEALVQLAKAVKSCL